MPLSLSYLPALNPSRIQCLRPQTLFPSLHPQTSFQMPKLVLIDGETSYEIEEILNSKFEKSKLLYLVKWKGYSVKHNFWELELNILPHGKKSLNRFHCSHWLHLEGSIESLLTTSNSNSYIPSSLNWSTKLCLMNSPLPDLLDFAWRAKAKKGVMSWSLSNSSLFNHFSQSNLI